MTNCNDGAGKPRLVLVPTGDIWMVEHVAEYLKVSKSWVWKQCRENLGLPFIRIGPRNYRFSPEAVKAWVASQGQQQGQVG